MKLYTYRDPVGNFGDDLNLWLWPRLLPGIFDIDDGRLFLGIGTLLNHRVPTHVPKLVFGTGVGYGDPPAIDDNLRIYCVRGPLSARALNLPAHYAITDPAVLVHRVELPPSKRGPELSFMPHHRSMAAIPWAEYCRVANVRLIDPTAPFFTTLRSLLGTRLLITESLHGAIVADALRIPWLPIRVFNLVLDFKWQDWCASLGLDYVPLNAGILKFRKGIRAQWKNRIRAALLVKRLPEIARSTMPVLSADTDLQRAIARLEECLERFRFEQGFDGPAR